ncbi:hypothetical protein DM01DRAFT_1337945 [Hesseltinella vesiculosa]|uniref:Mid2 domain-containing protein n=1 Tax=Hesseltinella vesiculosa TaxID=101127 RepID=A0A1X2GCG7_9FUNG|nr:hypothetical protein DM01DRAFT_1337945 [Hesseltinella vesiculosa]
MPRRVAKVYLVLCLLFLSLVLGQAAPTHDLVERGDYGNIPTPSDPDATHHSAMGKTSPSPKPTIAPSSVVTDFTTIIIITSNGNTFYEMGTNGGAQPTDVGDPNAGQIAEEASKDAAAEVRKLIAISTVVGGVGMGAVIAAAIFYVRYRNRQRQRLHKCYHPDHADHDLPHPPPLSVHRPRHRHQRSLSDPFDNSSSPHSLDNTAAHEYPLSTLSPASPTLSQDGRAPSMPTSFGNHSRQTLDSSPTSPSSAHAILPSPSASASSPAAPQTALAVLPPPPLTLYNSSLEASAPLAPYLSNNEIPERQLYTIHQQQRSPVSESSGTPLPSAPSAKEIELQALAAAASSSSSQQPYPRLYPTLPTFDTSSHSNPSSTSPCQKSLAGSIEDSAEEELAVPPTPDIPPPAYTPNAPLFVLPPPRRRRSADDISLDRFRRGQ